MLYFLPSRGEVPWAEWLTPPLLAVLSTHVYYNHLKNNIEFISFYFLHTEKNVAELVLPIVISLLLIIILAIVVVIVYRRWKKKRQNSGYLNDGEQVPMNPVTLDTVS